MPWVPGNSIITWKGDIGGKINHTFISKVTSVTSNSYLQHIVIGVQDYSYANVARIKWTNSLDLNDFAPGVGANCDRYALIRMKHPDTMNTHKFTLPAPTDDAVENTARGQRVKQSVVEAIVSVIAERTGTAFVPMYGVVYQRK